VFHQIPSRVLRQPGALQIGAGGFFNVVNAAEMSEQKQATFAADAGDVAEFGGEKIVLAFLPVEGDGEPVGFFLDLFHQMKQTGA